MKLHSIEEVLEDIKAGKPIVLIDDADRENEGDIVVAAEKITDDSLAFMMHQARGLICVSLAPEVAERLELPLQVKENKTVFGTNFGVGLDHKSVSGEGASASSRATTIRSLAVADCSPEDFVTPGYVFPVVAVEGGVFKRRGQTEGSVDLARLASLSPVGVICEIMGEDGHMLSGEDLELYCKEHDLKITSVDCLVKYRLKREVSARRVAECSINDFSGLGYIPEALSKTLNKQNVEEPLKVVVYMDDVDGSEHMAFVKGNPQNGAVVRIHSQCLTGDVFGSQRCDCGYQLEKALERIFEDGEGIVIYLHQEGRGIGLANKIRAYELQEKGVDTFDANVHLGFEPDERDYRVAAQILHDQGLTSVRMMTNNPDKLEAMKYFDIDIVERIVVPAGVTVHNADYLATKRSRMGHLLEEN